MGLCLAVGFFAGGVVPLALAYERALLGALEPEERQTLIALLDKLSANALQAESVL